MGTANPHSHIPTKGTRIFPLLPEYCQRCRHCARKTLAMAWRRRDRLGPTGLHACPTHPAWSAAGGRHPPSLRTGTRAGNEPSRAADLSPRRRLPGRSGPQLKPGTSVGAAWGQTTDSPADICLGRSVLTTGLGWGRPLQAADCRPGEGGREGRKGGWEAALFIASKQTNCFALRSQKGKRKKQSVSLLATGRAAGAIGVGHREKARSQARRGQGLPSGAPRTAGH